jgi:DNA-binding MarR family transcriptional regulator
MTRNLDRLKQKGLVTTEPDPTDKRAMLVTLSHEGRQAANRVARIESDFARSIADGLGESGTQQTIEALDRLLAVVRMASDACCPGAYDHLMPRANQKQGDSP